MNITPIVTKTKITSNALLRDISRRSSLNRMYERQTLELLKKSIEERKKTYSALSKRDKEGGGLLGNLLGGSLLLRRLRGRGPKGPGGIGPGRISPRSPRGGGTIGGGVGRFGRFGRIGPLALLGTGLDFGGRLGGGQNLAQATIGAGGGLAGLVAGGKVGAAIGTAILPGVGTFAGGLIGSTIGAIAGGNIADTLTGVNSDTRRRSTISILDKGRDKTQFSGALDQFDGTLKTLENDTAPTLMEFKKSGGRTAIANTPFMLPKGGINWNAVLNVAFIVWDVIDIIAMFKTAGASKAITIPAKIGIRQRIRNFFLPRTAARVLQRELTEAAIEKQAQKTIRNNLSKDLIGQRIISNRQTSTTSKMTKFFRDVDDQIFLNNLPGMSRMGNLKRQGANELLQTRIDGLLNVIRKDNIRSRIAKNKNIRNNSQMERFFKDNSFKRYQSVDDAIAEATGDIGARSLVERQSGSIIRDFTNSKSINRGFEQLIKDYDINPNDLQKLIKNDPSMSLLDAIQIQLRKKSTTGYFKRYRKGNRPVSVNVDANKMSSRRNTTENIEQMENVMKNNPELFKPKAEGGRVEAGTPYMVGELGKELFVPDVSGDIIPNDKLGPAIIAMTKDADTIIVPQGGGSGGSSRTILLKADPYDVVAKYAQMTGLFTV